MVKRCNGCGQEKLISMFYLENNGRPRSRCIECYSTVRKKPFVEPRWTAAEETILLRDYPNGGWQACNLPGRNAHAIRNRAYRLGIRMVREGAPDVPLKRHKELEFGIPTDDRPDEIKALDMALRCFRACEPAANLTWIIGAA